MEHDHKAISEQLLIEHELLTHLDSALRTILQWTSHKQDLPRKLSSLRFMTQAFQRHLEWLMTLEEHDGYMEVVVESRPTLSPVSSVCAPSTTTFAGGCERFAATLEAGYGRRPGLRRTGGGRTLDAARQS